MKLTKSFGISSFVIVSCVILFANTHSMAQDSSPSAHSSKVVKDRVTLAVQAFAKMGLGYIYAVEKAHYARTRRYSSSLPFRDLSSSPASHYYVFGVIPKCTSGKENIGVQYILGSGKTDPFLKEFLTRHFSGDCKDEKTEFLAVAARFVGKSKVDLWSIDQGRTLKNVQTEVSPEIGPRDENTKFSADISEEIGKTHSQLTSAMERLASDLEKDAKRLEKK